MRWILFISSGLILLIACQTLAGAEIGFNGNMEIGPVFGDGVPTLESNSQLQMKLGYGEKFSGLALLQYQTQTPTRDQTPGENALVMNQAYFDLALPLNSILRVGRQKISWGSGMAWNPTNYLGADKNRADLTNEFPGVDAVDYEKGFGQSSLVFILKKGSTANEWAGGVRYATRLGHHDLALSTFQQGAASGAGLDWATSLANFTFYSEIASKTGSGRYYIGTQDGQLIQLTRGSQARFWHGVLGCSGTFANDWTSQMEYYYNQEGWNAAEAENYSHYNGVLNFQSGSYFADLRTRYLCLQIRKGELSTDLNAMIMILGDLDDGSYMILPELEYRLGTNSTAELTITCYTGAQSTEFGSQPERFRIGAKVRISF